jgi:hypothetical protein
VETYRVATVPGAATTVLTRAAGGTGRHVSRVLVE